MDVKEGESSVGKSPAPDEKGGTPNGDIAVDHKELVQEVDTVKLEDISDEDDEEFKSCGEEREEDEDTPSVRPLPVIPNRDSDLEEGHLDPRNQKWSEALKAKLFASVDKESNFFSYMFLDKIFGEARPCRFCGARGTAKLPPRDDSLKLCVLEDGIVGRQNVLCTRCGEIDTVISCDDPKRFPNDDRLTITGSDIRSFCRNVTHYEILHDLMEMLHIAATDDDSQRQEKHREVADFMLKNVRKVCEEWCKPEYAELRLKKYLRLRDETLLTKYNPTFTPDCTEEYKEMYEMMANSFRQNRKKVLLLLQLMKESLIDSPTRSTFMMWVSIAMMHSESYSQFKMAYDPRSFMRVDSSEYQALQDRYLALEVPLGIKKIPVIFILFEIPRFYHYVEFLNQRIGKKKSRNYLTEGDRASLKSIEEETLKLGLRMKPRTGKMVSPEAHLDFLTRQEEYGREMIYQSCRDKEKAKQQKIHNALKAATSVKGKHPSSSGSRDGSLSPSTAKKSESSKSSSSKDSPSQASKSTATSASGNAVNGANGAGEKEKQATSMAGSENSKSARNKKKKKKSKVSNSEAESAPSVIEEDARKKEIEEEVKKRREEFISNDALHSILRETLTANEASKGSKKKDKEEEEEEERKKRRFRRFKRELEEDMEFSSHMRRKYVMKEERRIKDKEKKVLKQEEKKDNEKMFPKDEVKSVNEDEEKCSNDASMKEEEKKVPKEKEKGTTPSKEDTPKDVTASMELVRKFDLETQKKLFEEGQVPKAMKPEVNPDSPLANISLPPRPGLDPNRKPISLPSLEPTTTPASKYTTRSSLKKELREQMKAHKRHKKSGRDSRSVLCAQVDTEMLRAQGYKISGNSPVTTVIANSDGTIEHILEGLNTPEQVKAFLSRRYSILNQQAGSGYLTMPSKNDPGAIVVDQGSEINPLVNSAASKFSDTNSEPKMVGNPKKRKKAKLAQQNPAISSLMDCFAQQRQQSQGGWRTAIVQQQQEMVAGVMDEEMCGVLGGGDLTKALSNAFETVMARADSDEKSGSSCAGLPGINSYRINSDGSVREEDMFSPVATSPDGSDHMTLTSDKSGSGSSSSTDSERNGSGSCKDGNGGEKSGSGGSKDEKSGSGGSKDEKSGSGSFKDGSGSSKDKKSGSGSSKDEKSGSGGSKDEKNGSGSSKDEKSGSGSVKDEKSGSGSSKDEKSGSGGSKDEKSGSGGSKDEKSGSGSFKDEKSGSGSSKDEKSGSGGSKDEKSGSGSSKDEKSGSGGSKDEKSGSGGSKDEKSGSGSFKDEKSGSGSSKDEKSGSGGSKDEKSGSGSSKDEKSGSGSSKNGNGSSKNEKSGSGGSKDKKSKSGRSKDRKNKSGSSKDERRLEVRYRNRMVEKDRDYEGDKLMLVSRKSRSLKHWKERYKPLVKDKYCVANPDDLVPEGIISTAGWSKAKRDLFKNRMCRGIDEKVFTVDSEEEARAIFLQAMKPTDLGKLEGPCPRYVVPSAGGVGHLTGRFSLPNVGDVKDLDDFLKSPCAPRQQMILLDAMRFPYKLETTKVYIKRKDKDGNELPDKVTMVSKVTLLPKELAGRYCAIGHPTPGSILELTDSEDVVEDSSSDEDDILEIEAPPIRRDYPPRIVSSADIVMDAPPEQAVQSLTKVISETLASNKSKKVPVTIEQISESIMDCLKEMPNTEVRPNKYDDSELAISLLSESYRGRHKESKESGTKRRKIKKKPKKPKSVLSRSTSDRPSGPIAVDIADEDFHVVEMPPKSELEVVRDIDDIDDINIGVTEDLLIGAGIGGEASTSSTPPASATPDEDFSTAKMAQSKVAAREKFRTCDNCGSVIEDRILVCSSCKKVAYCNRRCQKLHWKSHKKTCSHKGPREDCTG